MCKTLKVSRSGFYAWLGRDESDRARDDRRLTALIHGIFDESRKTYGAPRVHRTLRKRDVRCGHNRVARLMKASNLRPRTRREFRVKTTNSNHKHPIAPDLLCRDFTATGPNQAWVSDISVPQKAVREMRDSPLAIGLQEQVANHRKRLGSKALVVSVAEKVPGRHQVRIEKANTSELPFKCRKYSDDVKPGS